MSTFDIKQMAKIGSMSNQTADVRNEKEKLAIQYTNSKIWEQKMDFQRTKEL